MCCVDFGYLSCACVSLCVLFHRVDAPVPGQGGVCVTAFSNKRFSCMLAAQCFPKSWAQMQEGSQGVLPELGGVFLPLLFCAYMSLMTKGISWWQAVTPCLKDLSVVLTGLSMCFFFFFLISLRTKGLIFFSWISAQASVPFASSVQTSAASIQAGCFRDEKAPNFLSVENWNPPSIGIYVFRYWLQVITVSPEELGPSEWISLLFFVLYFFINHLNFKGNYY